MNDFTQSFALDYAGARTKFRATASELGCALSDRHPTATGPDGRGLFIDVARLGDIKASSQLVVVSGTHGLEGLSGSAAQIGWMKSGFAGGLPRNVSVLLVHALNPFGFAHGTRTTENNVDLNRNFIDHAAPYPTNAGYAELYPNLLPDDWTPSALAAYADAVAAFRGAHGPDVLFDVQARGQYDFPLGTNFGGSQRQSLLTKLPARRFSLPRWCTKPGCVSLAIRIPHSRIARISFAPQLKPCVAF